MGYPIAGVEGNLTTWGSTNFYSTILSNCGPMSAALVVIEDEEDVTQLNATTQATLGKLKSWTGTVRAYSAATPINGNGSLIADANSTLVTTHCYDWTITLETANVFDITAMNVSDTLGTGAPKWKRFRPDYSRWGAEITCGVDSATAIKLPTDTGGTKAALTFTYGSSQTLVGNAIITRVSPVVERGVLTKVTYSVRGDGALTPTTTLLGNSAFGIPVWTAGGTTAGGLVVTPYSGKTWTGYDSFWTRLSLRAALNEPVMLEANIQGSGALVSA